MYIWYWCTVNNLGYLATRQLSHQDLLCKLASVSFAFTFRSEYCHKLFGYWIVKWWYHSNYHAICHDIVQSVKYIRSYLQVCNWNYFNISIIMFGLIKLNPPNVYPRLRDVIFPILEYRSTRHFCCVCLCNFSFFYFGSFQ
jgi:hypothetical protein